MTPNKSRIDRHISEDKRRKKKRIWITIDESLLACLGLAWLSDQRDDGNPSNLTKYSPCRPRKLQVSRLHVYIGITMLNAPLQPVVSGQNEIFQRSMLRLSVKPRAMDCDENWEAVK